MSAEPATSTRYIGLEVSAAILRAVSVAADGTIDARRTAVPDRSTLVAQCAQLLADLRAETGAERVRAIGIGVTGLVSHQRNAVTLSTKLPELADDFAALLTAVPELSDVSLILENDANAAAYGEFLMGAGQGSRDLFYATIGAGVGGAIIINGALWRGANGFAGEFGHITIDAEQEIKLEHVASSANIVRRTNERLLRDNTTSLSRWAESENFTVADITQAAQAGDDFALLMMERTGKFIGTAIASVINLLDIERIVLGGEVLEAGDLILDPVIREAGRRAFQPSFARTQIVAAALGTDAVALGAALLAREVQTEREK